MGRVVAGAATPMTVFSAQLDCVDRSDLLRNMRCLTNMRRGGAPQRVEIESLTGRRSNHNGVT